MYWLATASPMARTLFSIFFNLLLTLIAGSIWAVIFLTPSSQQAKRLALQLTRPNEPNQLKKPSGLNKPE